METPMISQEDPAEERLQNCGQMRLGTGAAKTRTPISGEDL
jgi:hypothetical protein